MSKDGVPRLSPPATSVAANVHVVHEKLHLGEGSG